MRQQTRPLPAGLDAVTVGDVMSSPLVTCAPDVPLREVAALMSGHAIHAVVVPGEAWAAGYESGGWGVISDLDLVNAAPLDDPAATAGRIAATPALTVRPSEPLAVAAQLMSEYGVTHVVVAVAGREPSGIISALDVARALAREPAEPGEGADRPAPPRARLTARPGDRLVIRGHAVGEPERDAEILEARGGDGAAPFLVRWDDGRVSLLYPGSDARVERLGRVG